ncbi:MAG: aminoglycoside phosphotransferase family protein [Verrucomicrobia bacterium]|nr:aminoglycoside phosphotransferase family protein [Verrucomicrobiota bacterium]
MDNLILLYQKRLNLHSAHFARIDHDEAMVAIVYKVMQPDGTQYILKISPCNADYFREVQFLKMLAGSLPVPKIVGLVNPEPGVLGAILMECLPGRPAQKDDVTGDLAVEIGALMARIHANRLAGYGDPLQPDQLRADPFGYFAAKFEEGLEECRSEISKDLIKQSRFYLQDHLNLLQSVDGPCLVHRDFRPANVMVCEGKLQGVIDWAGARASFAEEDFCPLEQGQWTSDSERKKSFLKGYASIRPVPNYSEMMPLLQLSKAIAVLGFTVKQGTWKTVHAGVYQRYYDFLQLFFQSSKNA